MRQPLKHPFQNDLAKVSGREWQLIAEALLFSALIY
jgi:hypothetical protein